MQTRTKIILQPTQLDKAVETTGLRLLILLWLITMIAFFTLPETIPTHYNALGQVDNYGSKTTLFILPAIASIIFIGITKLNKYPHIFNYTVTITQENTESQYTVATRMLRILKLVCVLVFFLIVLFTWLTTLGNVTGLGRWFLPFALSLVIIPVGYFLIKLFRSKQV